MRYEVQKEVGRIFGDVPGIVLSDIDAPYLNALLPKLFVAVPPDGTIATAVVGCGTMGNPRQLD